MHGEKWKNLKTFWNISIFFEKSKISKIEKKFHTNRKFSKFQNVQNRENQIFSFFSTDFSKKVWHSRFEYIQFSYINGLPSIMVAPCEFYRHLCNALSMFYANFNETKLVRFIASRPPCPAGLILVKSYPLLRVS